MRLYVVRNKEGKYFRPKGYGGYGNSWQDDLTNAKFYTKLGTAKGQVTFWFKNYPEFGCPEIMVFDLDPKKALVLNIQNEANQNIAKAAKRASDKQARYNAWRATEPRR